jgi:Tfp pilus assembly protein PilN
MGMIILTTIAVAITIAALYSLVKAWQESRYAESFAFVIYLVGGILLTIAAILGAVLYAVS